MRDKWIYLDLSVKRKVFRIFAVLLLVFCVLLGLLPNMAKAADVWDGSVAAGYAGGSGTSADPYQIATGAQLAYLASQVNAGNNCSYICFKLTDNINLNHKSWTPIGNIFKKFCGDFNGNSYTISNLSVSGSMNYAGLFGYANGGTIKNVGLINVSIAAASNDYITNGDKSAFGGVVGHGYGTNIINCYVTGSVTDDFSHAYVGGIIGVNDYGNVKNCYAACSVSGGRGAGGIAGENYEYSTMTDVYWNRGAIDTGVSSKFGTCTPVSMTSAEMKTNVFAAMLTGNSTAIGCPQRWKADPSVNDGYPVLDNTIASDTAAPVLTGVSTDNVSAVTSNGETTASATLSFSSGEAGAYYCLVYASDAAAPGPAAVEAQETAVAKYTGIAKAGTNTVELTGLSGTAAYKAYIIVEDEAGNISDLATVPISFPSFNSGTAASFDEHALGTVYTAAAAASSNGGAITYSITGGSDQASFHIDSSTGLLTFVNSPDYQSPADADTNNIYNVVITAADSNGSVSQGITIKVISTVYTLTAGNPLTTGLTVSLSPALDGLTAADFRLLDSSNNSAVIKSAATTDNGATYVISADLSTGQTYTITALKNNYDFGSPKNITVPIPEALTVSSLSAAGFTVALSPSITDLTASDFTLLDNSGKPVIITGAVTTDNGATYKISAALNIGQVYKVSASRLNYDFGLPKSFTVAIPEEVKVCSFIEDQNFTVSLSPALPGLTADNFKLFVGDMSVTVTSAATTDNGATYVVSALSVRDTETVTIIKSGYDFGSPKSLKMISETLTVDTPTTAGFTVSLSPALDDLTSADFKLSDSLGNPVAITGAATSDGGATYTISAVLSVDQTYTVTAVRSGYVFGPPQSITVIPYPAAVLGQPVNPYYNGDGTKASPWRMSFNVDNPVLAVGLSNIVASDSHATVTFYGTDSTFSNSADSSVSFTADVYSYYIYCTLSQDGYVYYYELNIIRGNMASNGDYLYQVNSDGKTCTISGYTGTDSIITIPNSFSSTYGSYKVTSIGQSVFSGYSILTKVTIPDSVTSIGQTAFYGCSGLAGIDIPNSVTSIGDYAFAACSGLTGVTIPSSVTHIGEAAFALCIGLTRIDVDAGNVNYISKNGILYDIDQSDLLCCPGALSAGTYSIPDGVTNINSYAFAFCSGLTYVTIPSSVTNIGYDAFWGCSGLTGIKVDTGNTSFCSRDGVLYDNDKSVLICYPAKLPFNTFCIPDSVKLLAGCAFYGCSKLTSVTIPDSVTVIAENAFNYCNVLTGIYFKGNMPTFGSGVFNFCLASLKYYCPTGHESSFTDIAVTPLDTHSITIISADNGSITSSTAEGMPGETISLNIAPASGYTLKSGLLKYVDNTGEYSIRGTSFTMPDNNITIYSGFMVIGADTAAPAASLASMSGSDVKVSTSDIILSFSENIIGVAGKKIIISDGADSYTYTIGARNEYISGTGSECKATIPIAGFINGIVPLSLDYGTTYTVSIEAGAYIDEAGNEIAGSNNIGSFKTEVTVTGVTLDFSTLNLVVGESKHLTASVVPENATNKKVAWSSDKPDTVTVTNDGTVTAVVAGSAAILVTTEDGGKMASCSVTVRAATHTVIFKDWDGTVLKTEVVQDKSGATAPVLTKRTGYTFTGWDTVYNNVISDLTVTAQYSKNPDVPVCAAALSGITVPVTGGIPVSAITETNEYAGTVTWTPADNQFKANTGYTATITLTPKQGYTMTGVKDNFFTVAGAASVSYSADSCIITAVFPQTIAVPAKSISVGTQNGTLVASASGSAIYAVTTVQVVSGSALTINWYDAGGNLAPAPAGLTAVLSTTVSGSSIVIVNTDITVKAGTYYFTVSGGGVTSGAATVTVSAADTPTPDQPVAVTGVTLDNHTLSLKPGETGQLTATVTPSDAANKNIIWSSSNEGAATVDSTGKVTATVSGSAIIMVTTVDGGRTDTCTVTVVTTPAPITHTVIFKDWNENVLKTVTVNDGEGAAAPANPERTGYTFTGWDKVFNNITGDLTVTAQYSKNQPIPITHTVTFKNWDGTVLKTDTVNDGAGAAAPANPERTGYTFTGWDKAFNNVTIDLTVTAIYSINSSGAGGNISTDSSSLGTPSISGSLVSGWDTIEKYIKNSSNESLTIGMNGCTVIPGSLLENLRGKDQSVTLDLGNGIEWTINGKDIGSKVDGKDQTKLKDIDLKVSLNTDNIPSGLVTELLHSGRTESNEAMDNASEIQISLTYKGSFGFTARLGINLGSTNTSRKANLFYYNPITGRMEFQAAATIDENGMAYFNFAHASDYVILMDRGDTLKTQMEGITVTPRKETLYIGGTSGKNTSLVINLPESLRTLAENDSDAPAVTYKSSNEKIAAVSAAGEITALKKGKATITTTVTINGISVSFQTDITVKKAYIKLVKSAGTLKKGQYYTYQAAGYGVDTSKITWTTTKKSIILIDRSSGKAMAKKTGTDYVVAKAGNISVKLKVTVK